MNAALYIYFANVLSNLGVFLAALGLSGLVGWGIFTLVYFIEYNKYHKKNWIAIWSIVLLAITVFVPSSKTMYMMAGALFGEKALESEIGQQTIELIKLNLQQELDKLRGAQK